MTFISNKKAHILYFIEDTIEAGVQLFGYEVKSIKGCQGSLEAAKAIIRGGEVFLVGAFIPPYQQANTPSDYDPYRTRKLLLKKSEISRMVGKLGQAQLTLVVLSFYSSNNRIKAELALCRQKLKADKRNDLRTKDDNLRMRRIVHQGFDE
jgi:SsrA-binding protein